MGYKSIIEENLMVGVLDILVLKLLSKEDMYGYQIKQEIFARSNETILIKEGTLYGPLYRLEKRGMVSTKRVVVGERRFRNYYHLEESGKEYLEESLEIFKTLYSASIKIIFPEIDDE